MISAAGGALTVEYDDEAQLSIVQSNIVSL